MFQNPQINLDDLPRAEDIDWQPMHKSLLIQIMIQQFVFVGIFVIVSVVFRFVPSFTFMPLWTHLTILLVLLIPLVAWPVFSVRRRGIAYREKDILYRSGVLVRRMTAIPFNRIQHVETKQAPLDRYFGTSGLQIFTAGGSKGDLNIEGLEKDLAETLRSSILKRIGSSVEQS